MELSCYLVKGVDLDIHPAPRRRSWMDDTPGAFAYRCLPLSIANVHGWEIRSPCTVTARWSGGAAPTDLEIETPDGQPAGVFSRFGSGVLTFELGAIFRTPPGYNMWVTGPANHIKDGIQPLTGVIETDWIPFPFAMNWKLTRPGHTVRFEKGEPFCLIYPIQRGVLETFEPELRDVAEQPELRRMFEYARNWRGFFDAVQALKGAAPADEHRFQRWYLRGQMPDGSEEVEGHQKHLSLRPFTRPGAMAGAPEGAEPRGAGVGPSADGEPRVTDE
jgi:hypothetical protein